MDLSIPLVNALIEWGVTPPIAITAALLVWNAFSQQKIMKELSGVVKVIGDRVLILETKEEIRQEKAA